MALTSPQLRDVPCAQPGPPDLPWHLDESLQWDTASILSTPSFSNLL